MSPELKLALLVGPVCSLVFFTPVWGPWLFFRPAPPRLKRLPWRCRITDVLALAIWIGVSSSIIAGFTNLSQLEQAISVLLVSFVLVLAWMLSVHSNSKFGIESAGPVLVMHLFFFPVATLGLGYLIEFAIVVVVGLIALLEKPWGPQASAFYMLFIALIIPTAVSLLLIHLLFRRTIAKRSAESFDLA